MKTLVSAQWIIKWYKTRALIGCLVGLNVLWHNVLVLTDFVCHPLLLPRQLVVQGCPVGRKVLKINKNLNDNLAVHNMSKERPTVCVNSRYLAINRLPR